MRRSPQASLVLFTLGLFWTTLLSSIIEPSLEPSFSPQLGVGTFNVESGGASTEITTDIIAKTKGIDLWGFTEVQNAFVASQLTEAAAEGEDAAFGEILGTTAREDRLLIVYNTDRLKLVSQGELHALNIGGNVRAPLWARFRLEPSGPDFIFMVNHLYRGNTAGREAQARGLNEWARKQPVPVITAGDFNFDWQVDSGATNHDRGYDLLTDNGVFRWVRPPDPLVPTNCGPFRVILDFVFVSGAAQSWPAKSEILFPEASYCPDTAETSDHRPVIVKFTIEVSAPGAAPKQTPQVTTGTSEVVDPQTGTPSEATGTSEVVDPQTGTPGDKADTPHDFMWQLMSWQRVLILGLVASGILYTGTILALFGFFPFLVVRWHEFIARQRLWGKAVSGWATLSLIGSERCLNAFVTTYSNRARVLFEEEPEVKSRPKWVPAPVRIGDELIESFSPPERETPYVAGLYEIRKRIEGQRWIFSIEGPGGAGKSSLAFQIARWAADTRLGYRLGSHPMLPLLLGSPGDDVEYTIKNKLLLLLGLPGLSPRLLRSLLRGRRILVIIDGISEALNAPLKGLRPRSDGRGHNLCALVITSRVPTHLSEALMIRPLGLEHGDLRESVVRFDIEILGGRTAEEERQIIVRQLEHLLEASRGRDPHCALPYLFLKLMVEEVEDASNMAAGGGTGLSGLPESPVALIEAYTERLLQNEPQPTEAIRDARRAAVICLGPQFAPRWRSRDLYQRELSEARLQQLVSAGFLLVKGLGDPLYKFKLDPVAEYLAALDWVIGFRDGRLNADALTTLEEMFAKEAAGFQRAVIEAADYLNVDFPLGVRTRRADGTPERSQQPTELAVLPPERQKVFISYSHKDRAWLTRLQTMLAPLVRKGTISPWDDTRIEPGEEWRSSIQKALETAKVAVLLVSDDFLASDFIAKHELPPLLDAAETAGVRILWIYVSPCLYEETPVPQYQAAHPDVSRSLEEMTEAEQNRTLREICLRIKEAVVASTAQPPPPA